MRPKAQEKKILEIFFQNFALRKTFFLFNFSSLLQKVNIMLLMKIDTSQFMKKIMKNMTLKEICGISRGMAVFRSKRRSVTLFVGICFPIVNLGG